MNKKFSTLMASVLLAGAFSTTAWAANDLKNGQNIGLDFGATPNALVIINDSLNAHQTLDAYVDSISASKATNVATMFHALDSALWTVKLTENVTSAGTDTTYQFANKLTGQYLSYKLVTNGVTDKATKMDPSGNTSWAYSWKDKTLYAFRKATKAEEKDSTFYLNSNLALVSVPGGPSSITTPAQIEFKQNPKDVTLNADVFNYIMKKNGGNLYFNNKKDVSSNETNPLTANKWTAVQFSRDSLEYFALTNGETVDGKTNDLSAALKKKKYLIVDTAYQDASALQYYKLAVDTVQYEAYGVSATDTVYFVDARNYGKKLAKRNALQARFAGSYSIMNDSIGLRASRVPVLKSGNTYFFENNDSVHVAWTEKPAAAPAAMKNGQVALRQLGNGVVLTVAGQAGEFKDGWIIPMIQPYASAPTGDAEITANAGLFFMKVENSSNELLRGASLTRYVVESALNPRTYEYQEIVDETNPYAQWVFVPGAAGSYSIVNRGSNNSYYNGIVKVLKDENGKPVANTYVIGSDTLALGAVKLSTDNVYTEDKKQYDYSGFFYAGPQAGKVMSFEISPVSPFMSSLAMQVQADSTVVLGDAEDAPIWYFDQVDGTTYGATITGVPQLKSVSYKVYMKDENNVKYYIVANGTNFVVTKETSAAGAAAAGLYFRTIAENTYLISNGLGAGATKMTINPTPAKPIIEATTIGSMKNDYFTVGKSSSNQYRTLTAEDGVNGNAAIYLNNETSRYLYENTANIVANNGKGLNFLGIFNAFELDKNPTVYVDTAYVEREGNTMPQYMFALGVKDVPATTGTPCTEAGVHVDKNGNLTTADKCVHATPATAGYKAGRYLVALSDSTENKSAKYDGATRLAFVPAKHYLGKDSLVIDNSKWTGNTKVMTAGKADTYASKDTIKIENNTLKAATFALLIKDQADQSFYLQTVNSAAGKAQYVRILNGVPVLTDSTDDAAIFNIEASEEEATANEAIEAAGVQVIGGQGAVTVQGAAGKVITVANVLGQTIANQVAASDNVTIAAPAGVVVVAVAGEATKVVVK